MTGARPAASLPRGLALALLLGVALLGWRAPTAQAEDAASCRSSGGVYEYISPGGGGCSHVGGNGMAILRSVTSVNTNSTGMICQIGGYPSTCADPVPVDNYWAYWIWTGSSWSYASVGAAADWPDPGSVRGWTLGNGVRPGWTPPRPATSTTTTSTTTTSTSAATTTTSAKGTRPTSTSAARSASGPTAATPGRSSPGRTASASPSPAARGVTTVPAPSSVDSGGPDGATPVAISATPTSSGVRGTPWGALVGVALVALGGAGVIAARRGR